MKELSKIEGPKLNKNNLIRINDCYEFLITNNLTNYYETLLEFIKITEKIVLNLSLPTENAYLNKLKLNFMLNNVLKTSIRLR